MINQQPALLDLLAEQAEARVRELVEEARAEFNEAAERAFALALSRCFRRPTGADTLPYPNGESQPEHLHAG
jgi:hypothetical protein